MKVRVCVLDDNVRFMREAINQARLASDEGEVPVGAVIIKDNKIIALGRNKCEQQQNAICHAEIMAISEACEVLGQWRLNECDMFVTLEPCPMCAGAIMNARLRSVTFGAKDKKNGAVHSVIDLFTLVYGYRPRFVSGILEDECSMLLTDFFRRLR